MLNNTTTFLQKNKKIIWSFLALLFIAYYLCLPRTLFKDPLSMVLEDDQGQLLGAKIATDGQWRFPVIDSVPIKFTQAITTFEDKRFYSHWGIDLRAMARAMKLNLQQGRVVSGGSTLSMQVIRLSRKGKSRSVWQKLIEIILATRLEWRFSKNEILNQYASHAPFGGNVVGLEAASWRYYGKSPWHLSWAEAATLAVLPNAPALIHPGRNRKRLKTKRDALLDRLQAAGYLDRQSCELAKEEPLQERPQALPRLAPHLLERAAEQGPRKLRTTIRANLQRTVNRIVKEHSRDLAGNEIHNLAAIIIEVETGNILAYTGNAPGTGGKHQEAVDIIRSPRSTGSILKPFLYAGTQQSGNWLPKTLVADIPTHLNGYQPENFHLQHDGLVPWDRCLIRSLNVPMVRVLKDYGLEKFHFELKKLGFNSINKPPEHYGLTLILGGAEASLEEISNAYAGMARTLNHFYEYNGTYDATDFRPLNFSYQKNHSTKPALGVNPPIFSAGAIWLTFEAMRHLERPNSSGAWERFESSRPIAWKTGTSYGFRDAWAVGITPGYGVGVWAGNADGEGRPGLVGVRAAAPVLFNIFEQLPPGAWFEPPYDELKQIPVCRVTGFRANRFCPVDSSWVLGTGLSSTACPYHRLIHTDASGQYQVDSRCADPEQMRHQPWLVIPPIEAYYYARHQPDYAPLPPFLPACVNQGQQESPMQFIYPTAQSSRIYVPVDMDGTTGRTVFQLAHRNAGRTVHWHLDHTYLGSTTEIHEMALNPSVGKHTMTLVDEKGERLVLGFEIVGKGE